MAAAEAAVSPTAVPRRSFVHRVLQQAGARFAPVNDGAIAVDFGKPVEAEMAQARRMGIADLSVLPRTGFKGAGTVEWLSGQGLSIGPDSNRAYPQSGGELAARLAPTEIFLIDGLAGTGDLIHRLNAAWSWGSETPRTLTGYPMPRSESHAWFLVTGAHAPAMFAKICGVDLRTHRFAIGSIAQTSLAKMSAIIIRADLGDAPAFHVLADSASAEYLWGCLLDAMAEFDGAPVGWAAIRQLAGVR
jgi:sarcosine oxidase, subunit gamma